MEVADDQEYESLMTMAEEILCSFSSRYLQGAPNENGLSSGAVLERQRLTLILAQNSLE